MSFCTKVEKREVLEGKSNNVAYIFIFFYNRYLGYFLLVKGLELTTHPQLVRG